jgi:phage N-6-adenine-methyltransferase
MTRPGPSRQERTHTVARTRWSTLFSSRRQDWATPQHLYDELTEEFRFTLDPCATRDNAKCERYFTPDDDGLSQDWAKHRVWCNPPYNELYARLRKGDESSRRGALVVFLIPARTDTRAWHEHVMHASEIRFIQGRLTFAGATNTAPFPSAIVIFRPPNVRPVQLSLFDNSTGAEEVR